MNTKSKEQFECYGCLTLMDIDNFKDKQGRRRYKRCHECQRRYNRTKMKQRRDAKKAAAKKSKIVLWTTADIIKHIATQSRLTCGRCGYGEFTSAIQLINPKRQDELYDAIYTYVMIDSSDANWAVINNLLIAFIPICFNCLSHIEPDEIHTYNPISPQMLPIKSPRNLN